MSSTVEEDREAIAAIQRAITASWRSGRMDDLADLFHERMVIAGPGYRVHASGRMACVDSYREFAASTAVTAYDESAPAIHVWADTAVASYAWTMTYRRDGAPSTEAGTDQLVLGRDQGRWRVLYRLLLFEPVSNTGG